MYVTIQPLTLTRTLIINTLKHPKCAFEGYTPGDETARLRSRVGYQLLDCVVDGVWCHLIAAYTGYNGDNVLVVVFGVMRCFSFLAFCVQFALLAGQTICFPKNPTKKKNGMHLASHGSSQTLCYIQYSWMHCTFYSYWTPDEVQWEMESPVKRPIGETKNGMHLAFHGSSQTLCYSWMHCNLYSYSTSDEVQREMESPMKRPTGCIVLHTGLSVGCIDCVSQGTSNGLHRTFPWDFMGFLMGCIAPSRAISMGLLTFHGLNYPTWYGISHERLYEIIPSDVP